MESLAQALLIFALRVFGIAVSTLATILTVQGRKLLAVLSGSLSTLVYVLAIAQVVTNLRNIPNLVAYVAGFGVGTWVGMLIEEQLALGYSEVRVIFSDREKPIAESLRQAGFGVTQLYGYGKEGSVGILDVFVPRKKVPAVIQIVEAVDPQAIVTVSEARIVRRAYWRPPERKW